MSLTFFMLSVAVLFQIPFFVELCIYFYEVFTLSFVTFFNVFSGIGIVNAIEVVNAFPEEDGLQKFREWIESPDPAILGKLGVEQRSSSKKKGSRTSKKGTNNSKNKREGSAADYNPGQEDDDIEARNDVQNNKLSFMNKHVNLSSRFKWYLICSFLSLLTCFIFPLCDTCREM